MIPENLFAGAYLDRRAEARLRDNWLSEANADPHTLYIGVRRGLPLLRQLGGDPTASQIAFLAGSDPRVLPALTADGATLLGWFRQQRCVLLHLDDALPLADDEDFADLRPMACELPAEEAGLAAYARALSLWRMNHRHCGRCGTALEIQRAGHALRCVRCEHSVFPRIDPAIIVLVTDGERTLLGRQASWAPRRYSTIAGFVEPGESLEDAVRREVYEETGIRVTSVAYHSSQPWPFPSALMLGFQAQGLYADTVMHDGELEDARWFTRAQILDGEITLPPPEAISRRLIEQWLRQAP
jgi:NAD+ diphosphatase